ncbi:hypothetical protein CGCF415_v002848 [Colletotrichum fructicola]|uniref:Uncharacterized protein n=1 Tax=Colletotrichum fructicola (strain Nara gc5) TaxID=1213859 RepID=A0A7J6J5A2_COLFN|nr:hypothetical protein CGGC5_v006992 [Colletotrichum fructicola Nara gc5]KAF4913718.1 hypothetical protein CGCF415_v002848 [Colletotrichum fructicola]KAF4938176.1 hypothetical protein CGCF245_v004971 [Colletotrichum fructicola]
MDYDLFYHSIWRVCVIPGFYLLSSFGGPITIIQVRSCTLMHWLLSNALFIVVYQGDYYQVSKGYWNDPISLPPDVTLVMGTAPLPLLLIIIVRSVMSLFARLRAQTFLPGQMPIAGSNSLAIEAACEVSPLAKVPGFSREDRGDMKEMELLEFDFGSNVPHETDGFVLSDSRDNIAFRLLKWGELRMPDEWHRQVAAENDDLTPEDIGHLGFGTILDDPKSPTEGRYYM